MNFCRQTNLDLKILLKAVPTNEQFMTFPQKSRAGMQLSITMQADLKAFTQPRAARGARRSFVLCCIKLTSLCNNNASNDSAQRLETQSTYIL
jgi:hypothetical protein